jgi:ClpP class serine protease
MTGVRTGFDGLRGEVEKIKSEMIGELCAMGGAVEKAVVAVAKGLQTEVDETRGKFEDEVKERRRLHNLGTKQKQKSVAMILDREFGGEEYKCSGVDEMNISACIR